MAEWPENLKYWDGTQWRPAFDLPACSVVAVGGGSSATTTTLTAPSSVNGGASFTLSGTVKTVSGANATNGSVQLQYNTGSGWTNYSTSMSITAGTFSKGSVTETETRQWRAVYTPTSTFLTSTSTTKTVTRKELTTLTKTYNCTASASYRSDGTKRTDTDHCYQGYISSVNGNQLTMLIFPQSTINSDLSGIEDITKVELFLNALHWGPDSGGTAVINEHTQTSLPASNPTYATTNRTLIPWSTKTGSKWCNLPTVIGDRIRAGTMKGLTLGQGVTTSSEYYGYFSGATESYLPKLRITYREYV